MGSGSLIRHMAARSGILIAVKLLGIAARIPLIRVLGAEGIGLYQMAYAFYGIGLTAVSGGLPTSLALTTAENHSLGRHLFKRLALLLFALGLGAGFFCYRFADHLANSLGNAELAFSIRCMAPAIVIVPLLTLMRGYLQGRNVHVPIALSELVEQIVRLTFMMLLVYAWLPSGLSSAVGGAMVGAVAGAIGAVLFLFGSTRLLFSGSEPEIRQDVISPFDSKREITIFLYSSLTVTATRFIVPLSDFLDAYIVPNRLQAAGYSVSEAVSIFGELAGMGGLVVYMPTLITSALAYTLSPKLIADRVANKSFLFTNRSVLALRIGWLWHCFAALILMVYAEPLASIIFGNDSAAKAIRWMALIPIFAGLRELTTVVFWAKGNHVRPLQGLSLAIVGSVLCNYILVAIPGFGYAGAIIGMASMELIATSWSLFILKKKYRIALPLAQTLSETARLIVCFFIVYSIFHPLHPAFQMIAISFVCIGYLSFKIKKDII